MSRAGVGSRAARAHLFEGARGSQVGFVSQGLGMIEKGITQASFKGLRGSYKPGLELLLLSDKPLEPGQEEPSQPSKAE